MSTEQVQDLKRQRAILEQEIETYRVDNYIKGENLETLKKQLEEANARMAELEAVK